MADTSAPLTPDELEAIRARRALGVAVPLTLKALWDAHEDIQRLLATVDALQQEREQANALLAWVTARVWSGLSDESRGRLLREHPEWAAEIVVLPISPESP